MGAKMDKVVSVFCFEVDVDTTQTEPIRTGYLGGRQGILTGTLEACGSVGQRYVLCFPRAISLGDTCRAGGGKPVG